MAQIIDKIVRSKYPPRDTRILWIDTTDNSLKQFTSKGWTNISAKAVEGILIKVTYSKLKNLRDNAKLIPGYYYRITDYQCTTTQLNTRSAGHQFDIIVRADSDNKLNEEASAIQHEGDEYFANSNLSTWKIWYCLDNDTTRFSWSDDINGKGVIYRMIDEFNNDIPYDFKNIQFKHPNDTTTYPYYYYTFASSNVEANTDYSLSINNNIFSNRILAYIDYNKHQNINKILFIGSSCYNNTFGIRCYNNTFKSYCYGNIFGYNCSNNTFDSGCTDIFLENTCNNNTFGYNCHYITFKSNCHRNTLVGNCNFNTFGQYCQDNILGTNCNNNTFNENCCYIKFASSKDNDISIKYSFYENNHFGNGCKYIIFTGIESSSSFNLVQNYNFAQGLQGKSSAYLTINGVRNRDFETKVAKNSSGELKIYCEADLVQ